MTDLHDSACIEYFSNFLCCKLSTLLSHFLSLISYHVCLIIAFRELCNVLSISYYSISRDAVYFHELRMRQSTCIMQVLNSAVQLHRSLLEDGDPELEKRVSFKELTASTYVKHPCCSLAGTARPCGVAASSGHAEKTHQPLACP